MPADHPSRCPVCSAPNGCAVIDDSRADDACWCRRSTVDPALRAWLATEGVDEACLCARCARGEIPSPCIGVCKVDAHGAACIGCGRTLEEIGAWAALGVAARAAVVRRLRGFRDARG